MIGDRVRVAIDRTIASLAAIDFPGDPVVSRRSARVASIVMSAYKRHGNIIDLALRECLGDSERYRVWSEPQFRISAAADHLAITEADARRALLPYGNADRTVQLDMLVYDLVDECIRSYEIKRANGGHDSGKVQQIKRNLACVQALLVGYGDEGLICTPRRAESWIVCYYGVQAGLYKPRALTRDQLDAHFDIPVVDSVEAATAYYRERLDEVLA